MINPAEAIPLTSVKPNKLEEAKKVFFFERNDGSILAVDEVQAWSLWARKQQMLYKHGKRPDFKLIGTGDGEIFRNAVMEAQAVVSTDLKKAQQILREGEAKELEACRGKIIAPRNMDTME